MTHSESAPRAATQRGTATQRWGNCTARNHDCVCLSPPQPGDTLEIVALAGTIAHADAFRRLRDCDVPPEVIFTDDIAARIARLLLYGEEPFFDADDRERADAWLIWCEWNRWPRADWACASVDQLVRERMARMLAPTLAWAADAIRRETYPLEHVRREVVRAFDLALGRAAA